MVNKVLCLAWVLRSCGCPWRKVPKCPVVPVTLLHQAHRHQSSSMRPPPAHTPSCLLAEPRRDAESIQNTFQIRASAISVRPLLLLVGSSFMPGKLASGLSFDNDLEVCDYPSQLCGPISFLRDDRGFASGCRVNFTVAGLLEPAHTGWSFSPFLTHLIVYKQIIPETVQGSRVIRLELKSKRYV